MTLSAGALAGAPAQIAHSSYVISTRPRALWNLLSVRNPRTGAWRKPARKGPCWAILSGRSGPCQGCPAPDGRLGVLSTANQGYRLVQMTHRAGAARIDACTFDGEVVATLFREQLRRFATRARLSGREHEVLQRILAPGPAGAIAAQLGITVRTVRFHVRNLLRKTGTVSRQDLLLAILGLATATRARE